MNRSILIVICDFLLVSLLAFSSVDINKVSQEGVQRQIKVDLSPNQPENRQDLAAVMRLALDDERKTRDRLQGQLTETRGSLDQTHATLVQTREDLAQARATATQTRESLNQTREDLEKKQAALAERNEQVQNFQKELQTREQQTLRLEQEKARVQQQYAEAVTNLQVLQQQLQTSTTDAVITKEKLAATEAEVRRQQSQASALEQQLGHLAQSNQVVLAEKQQLATQLLVAETEKRAAVQQVAKMQDEVRVEREEKSRLTAHADKLADGVKVLASKSGDLAEGVKTLTAKSTELSQEIRENRPLAPNTIFNEFVTNRVHARMHASRSGIFGIDSSKHRECDLVLLSDGTNTFAVGHVEDTPLSFWSPGANWESLTGTLTRSGTVLTIPSVIFARVDPRVVLIPLTPNQARDLGCKIYRTTPDPFKFQEAVIVGARESYYGECKFQMDLTAPDYVKMDRNLLKGLFGKFNPSRGDLVFSKTGDLLGVMANGTYCVMLRHFNAAGSLQFGLDVRAQRSADVLDRLYWTVDLLPSRLH